jgi:hypothetical protein
MTTAEAIVKCVELIGGTAGLCWFYFAWKVTR